jgi:dTDP-glucose 4,6-dehydratase
MKHVIVGGCGFTGRHLHRRLRERGEPTLVVDLPAALAAAGLPAREAHPADLEDPPQVAALPLGPDDVVHHLAARQFHGAVPRRGREAWFAAVNLAGTGRLLERMERAGCRRLVFFSTDMVYGLPERVPVPPDHPRRPLGPYGASKRAAEDLCRAYRARGLAVTIFRPRLIVGPGRLGVLARLFGLIERGRPVPLIGDGGNRYQMVSVADCVAAVEAALARGVPDGEFNLGSLDPPSVRELLGRVIAAAGSRSRLVPIPARPLKAALATLDAAGLPLLHREQYAIADVDYLVDVGPTTAALGWRPRHDDAAMLAAAYAEFRTGRGVVPRGEG